LRLSGVVRIRQERLQVRNPIYGLVFNDDWVRSNLPDAELRRQRAAYRRGVAWATAVSSLVLAAVTLTGIVAVSAIKRSNQQQRMALARSYLVQAQMLRNSGRAGHRVDSLRAVQQARLEGADEVALRDEAIASMALTDLQHDSNGLPVITEAVTSALNDGATHLAVADSEGRPAHLAETEPRSALFGARKSHTIRGAARDLGLPGGEDHPDSDQQPGARRPRFQ
jgi:hypothetical protein